MKPEIVIDAKLCLRLLDAVLLQCIAVTCRGSGEA